MKIANQNCPVCNCQIQDGEKMFCPTCHWELISIPNTASQGLKKFYNEKLELHKSAYRETDKLSEEIFTKEKLLDKLEKQKAELEAENKSLNSDVANQKPLLDKVKKLENDITVCQEKIKELTDGIEKEKEKLQKEKAAHQATITKSGINKFNTK